MITKEEITIKVPFEVAEAYRNATEEEREQLQLKIAAIMQSQFTTPRLEAIARLLNTMDKASLEAQERGLTPEILESILKAAIENFLNAEPLVYRVGTTLVVESTRIGNLETSVEQMREERINGLIADYESPI